MSSWCFDWAFTNAYSFEYSYYFEGNILCLFSILYYIKKTKWKSCLKMSLVLYSHVRRHQSSFFCHPHSSVLFPASTRVLRIGLPGQGPWREQLQPLTRPSFLPAPAFFMARRVPKIRRRVHASESAGKLRIGRPFASLQQQQQQQQQQRRRRDLWTDFGVSRVA